MGGHGLYNDDAELEAIPKAVHTGAFADDIDTSALTTPRGNGKTTLGAHLLARALTPGDVLHHAGTESLILAGSLKQVRELFKQLKPMMGDDSDYRWSDSPTSVSVIHKPTGTRVQAIASNSKTAFGIVGVPLIIADEPGTWQATGGAEMHDAIQTALGKPESPMRVIYLGTLAPQGLPGHWWYDLVADGSRRSTFVMRYQGDAETWDQWNTIQKCNPLFSKYPVSRLSSWKNVTMRGPTVGSRQGS